MAALNGFTGMCMDVWENTGKLTNIRSRLILSVYFNNYVKLYPASCANVPFHHLKSVKNCEPSQDHTEHINGHRQVIQDIIVSSQVSSISKSRSYIKSSLFKMQVVRCVV